MSVKVRSRKVYHQGVRPAVDDASAVIVEGPSPHAHMIDRFIEDDAVRVKLQHSDTRSEANICIGIQPGEERLGELRVHVQFEGPKGQVEVCREGHNELLAEAGEWFAQFFERLGGDWEVDVIADPCPKTEKPMALTRFAQQLEQTQSHGVAAGSAAVVQGPSQQRKL